MPSERSNPSLSTLFRRSMNSTITSPLDSDGSVSTSIASMPGSIEAEMLSELRRIRMALEIIIGDEVTDDED